MSAAAAWALCLLWAASPADLPAADGGPPETAETVLPVRTLTLAWTHSIERVRWEEVYELLSPAEAGRRCAPVPRGALCPQRARVRGSGAGMEPAPGAVRRDGWYEWAPAPAPVDALRLMHSAHAADYTLCLDGTCRPLPAWMRDPAPGDGVVRLRACPADTGQVRPTPAAGTSG